MPRVELTEAELLSALESAFSGDVEEAWTTEEVREAMGCGVVKARDTIKRLIGDYILYKPTLDE